MAIVPFPFSDLTQTKRRPALVLADVGGDDIILCMITSRAVRDRYAVPLEDGDFISGGLSVPSNARPSRLFTADASIVQAIAGTLSASKLAEIIAAVKAILDE